MREININITKAKIKGFNVDMRENADPIISVTIGLISDAGDEVTTYTISSYYGNNNFDIPPSLTAPIIKMLGEFEVIAAEHCNNRMKLVQGQ